MFGRALQILVVLAIATPGLARQVGGSFAIVQECRVAEVRGFGGLPADARLQAGSLGKPVAAFAILTDLAARGQLAALDRPLGNAAVADGLTPPAWARQVTLRQLLSHSAGLDNSSFPASRVIYHLPGSRWAYSGNGFAAAQRWSERMANQPIDAIARERLFGPSGMTGASYTDDRGLRSGHDRAALVLMMGAIFAVAGLVLAGSAAALLARRRVRAWRFGPREVSITLVGGAVAGTVGVMLVVGLSAALAFLLLAAVSALAALIAVWGAQRWLKFRGRSLIAMVVGTVAAVALLAPIKLPVTTKLATGNGNIAFSLTARADDLARFAIAVMRPANAYQAAAAAQFTAPVIAAVPRDRWGTGIAIRQVGDRRFLYQWGSVPGFNSLLVMEPARCAAMVVLTDDGQGRTLAEALVNRRLGTSERWKP